MRAPGSSVRLVASSTESAIRNTVVRPVISNTLRMRAWVQTSVRSPSWLRRRLSPPTRTPRPVESRKSTDFEVDDDLPVPLTDQLDQLLPQTRGAVDVDLAFHGQDCVGRSAVNDLQAELHKTDLPKWFAVSVTLVLRVSTTCSKFFPLVTFSTASRSPAQPRCRRHRAPGRDGGACPVKGPRPRANPLPHRR